MRHCKTKVAQPYDVFNMIGVDRGAGLVFKCLAYRMEGWSLQEVKNVKIITQLLKMQ